MSDEFMTPSLARVMMPSLARAMECLPRWSKCCCRILKSILHLPHFASLRNLTRFTIFLALNLVFGFGLSEAQYNLCVTWISLYFDAVDRQLLTVQNLKKKFFEFFFFLKRIFQKKINDLQWFAQRLLPENVEKLRFPDRNFSIHKE